MNQTAGIQTKVEPARGGYRVLIRQEDSHHWVEVTQVPRGVTAHTIAGEIRAGRYNKAILHSKVYLHHEPEIGAAPPKSKRCIKRSAENTLDLMLDFLWEHPGTLYPIEQIADAAEVSADRAYRLIFHVLKQDRVDRVYRNGIPHYASKNSHRAPDVKEALYEAIRSNPDMNMSTLMDHVGVHLPYDFKHAIMALVVEGRVKKIGSSKVIYRCIQTDSNT